MPLFSSANDNDALPLAITKASDLSERLCFVKTAFGVKSAASDAVATELYWPCLQFDNPKQMSQTLQYRNMAQQDKRSKTEVSIQLLRKTVANPMSRPVALLLGNKKPDAKSILFYTVEPIDFHENLDNIRHEYASNYPVFLSHFEDALVQFCIPILEEFFEFDSNNDLINTDTEITDPATLLGQHCDEASRQQKIESKESKSKSKPEKLKSESKSDFSSTKVEYAAGVHGVERELDQSMHPSDKSTLASVVSNPENKPTDDNTQVEKYNDDSGSQQVSTRTKEESTVRVNGKEAAAKKKKESVARKRVTRSTPALEKLEHLSSEEVSVASRTDQPAILENKPDPTTITPQASHVECRSETPDLTTNSETKRCGSLNDKMDELSCEGKSIAKGQTKTKGRRQQTSSVLMSLSDSPAEGVTNIKVAKRTTRLSRELPSDSSLVSDSGQSLSASEISGGVSTSNTSNHLDKKLDSVDLKIPLFAEVKPLLEAAGYLFKEGLFCRPNDKGDQGERGRNVFETEEAFKTHLCAFGISGQDGIWTEDEKNMLSDWVKYSIVKSVRINDRIPDHELFSPRDVYAMLNRLGYKFTTEHLIGNQVWLAPGVKIRDGRLGVNMFPGDGNYEELFGFLARNGLPDTCSLENIDKTKLLSFELYIACSDIERFREIDIQPEGSDSMEGTSPDFRCTRKRSCRSENGSSQKSSHPPRSSSKLPKPKKLRSDVSQAKDESVTEDSMVCDEESTADPFSPTFPLLDMTQMTPIKNVSRVSISPLVPAPAKAIGAHENDSPSSKLHACLASLDVSGTSRQLGFDRLSQFGMNIERIMTFMDFAIASHSENETTSAALYVCGGPGTGKTSSVLKCAEKIISRVKKLDDGLRIPLICHISASMLSSSDSPLRTILEEISTKLEMKSTDVDKIKRKLGSGKVLILILDEIDLMVSSRSSLESEGRLPPTEEALRNISDWIHKSTNFPLVLIGISNTIANEKYEKLQSLIQFQDIVTFSRYSESDLMRIFQSRISSNVVAENALSWICKKVSQTSGDVREAFDLAKQAIRFASESVHNETGNKGPLVTMKHVMKVNQKSSKQLENVLGGLPQAAKIFLCVLFVVTEEDIFKVTLGKLKSFVDGCLKQSPDDLVSIEDFAVILEMLIDYGVLNCDGNLSTSTSSDLPSRVFELGVQCDEVKTTLQQELNKHKAYFDKIRQTAREKKHLIES